MAVGSKRGEVGGETYGFQGGLVEGSFFAGDGVDFGPPFGPFPLEVGRALPGGIVAAFFQELSDCGR